MLKRIMVRLLMMPTPKKHLPKGYPLASDEESKRYKGVAKRKSRWRARLRFKGKDINLGQFATEVEAAKAYDAAARQYLEQFALLNFPQENERGALRGGA